jgi:hypothetical protein
VEKAASRKSRFAANVEERSEADIEECCGGRAQTGAFCWDYYLDHAGTDQSADDLTSWVGQEWNLFCSGPGNSETWGTAVNGVLVYACIEGESYCESFSTAEVKLAMGLMGTACPAYMAGYYRFDTGESLQPKIIGKCSAGERICV